MIEVCCQNFSVIKPAVIQKVSILGKILASLWNTKPHRWKFQVKSSSNSRVPEKGCYLTDRSVKYQMSPWNRFSLFGFIWPMNLIPTKDTGPIGQFILAANLKFRSVEYEPKSWSTWNFVNHLRLSISVTGKNFKFIALANHEI